MYITFGDFKFTEVDLEQPGIHEIASIPRLFEVSDGAEVDVVIAMDPDEAIQLAIKGEGCHHESHCRLWAYPMLVSEAKHTRITDSVTGKQATLWELYLNTLEQAQKTGISPCCVIGGQL